MTRQPTRPIKIALKSHGYQYIVPFWLRGALSSTDLDGDAGYATMEKMLKKGAVVFGTATIKDKQLQWIKLSRPNFIVRNLSGYFEAMDASYESLRVFLDQIDSIETIEQPAASIGYGLVVVNTAQESHTFQGYKYKQFASLICNLRNQEVSNGGGSSIKIKKTRLTFLQLLQTLFVLGILLPAVLAVTLYVILTALELTPVDNINSNLITPDNNQIEGIGRLTIRNDIVDCRETYSHESNAMAQISGGETFTVLAQQDGWYLVKGFHDGCWVSSTVSDFTPYALSDNSLSTGTEDASRPYLPPAVAETSESFTDEGMRWNCTRENSNGSGSMQCEVISTPDRTMFSFADGTASITFHLVRSDSAPTEVYGVQVEGSQIEPAYGFCELSETYVECHAASGPEKIKYTGSRM